MVNYYIGYVLFFMGILLMISLFLNFIIFYILPFFILKDNKIIFQKFLKFRFPYFGILPFPYFKVFSKKEFDKEFNRIFFYGLIKETDPGKTWYFLNFLRVISRINSFIVALIFLILILIAFIIVIFFIISFILRL